MRIPKKKIEKWFKENLLTIVSAANTCGWGDMAYREDFEGIIPEKLKPFIGNIQVPRHRDGEYDGDFVIPIRHSKKNIVITCTKEVLAMCKAFTDGQNVDNLFNRILAGDNYVMDFYEQSYRLLRKEIYSKN